MNHFTISSKYLDMVCYSKWEASSGPISFEVQENDIWTDNHLSCHSSSKALGTRAIIELARLKCKWKGNEMRKGTYESPPLFGYVFVFLMFLPAQSICTLITDIEFPSCYLKLFRSEHEKIWGCINPDFFSRQTPGFFWFTLKNFRVDATIIIFSGLQS